MLIGDQIAVVRNMRILCQTLSHSSLAVALAVMEKVVPWGALEVHPRAPFGGTSSKKRLRNPSYDRAHGANVDPERRNFPKGPPTEPVRRCRGWDRAPGKTVVRTRG